MNAPALASLVPPARRVSAGRTLALLVVLAVIGAAAPAAEPAVLTLPEGPEPDVQSPVLLPVTLPADLLAAAREGRLTVAEIGADGKPAPAAPAQFAPASEAEPGKGVIGFFAPAGGKGQRRFQLAAADKPAPGLKMTRDEKSDLCSLSEGERAIVGYNFGTVPVPAGVSGKYAVARSNYVHPLLGPSGEVLTYDYSKDHPHHRGLYWAWPETYWKGQVRDLHALQGCFARPVKLEAGQTGPVWAALTAENRWMWDDKQPIVHERATIRAFAQAGGRRCVDFEFTFTALEEGLQLATRGQNAYGGFNCRFSARQGQKVVPLTDKADASPRVAAAQIVGTPPEGKGPLAVILLQHAGNPCYPGAWVSYPNLNWLQPTFPANGTKYPLDKDKPLTLRYRLVIQAGEADEATMRALWAAYNAK